MRHPLLARIKEKTLDQIAGLQIQRGFVGLARITVGALVIVFLPIIAPSLASGQSLQEQLAEIEEVLPGNSYTKFSPALAVQFGKWLQASLTFRNLLPARQPSLSAPKSRL